MMRRYLGLPDTRRYRVDTEVVDPPMGLPGGLPVLWARGDYQFLDGSSKAMIWYDKSGTGNHLSQATSTKRPTLSTVNGKTVLTFLRSSVTSVDALSLVGFPSAPADQRKYTIFVMYRPTVQINSLLLHLSKDSTTLTDGTYLFVLNGGNAHSRILQHPPGSTSSNYTQIATGTPRYTVDYWQSSDNKLYSRENGVNKAVSSVAVAANSIAAGAFRAGGAFTNTASAFNGDIGEIIIYPRELPLVEIQTIESYMSSYWGI